MQRGVHFDPLRLPLLGGCRARCVRLRCEVVLCTVRPSVQRTSSNARRPTHDTHRGVSDVCCRWRASVSVVGCRFTPVCRARVLLSQEGERERRARAHTVESRESVVLPLLVVHYPVCVLCAVVVVWCVVVCCEETGPLGSDLSLLFAKSRLPLHAGSSRASSTHQSPHSSHTSPSPTR